MVISLQMIVLYKQCSSFQYNLLSSVQVFNTICSVMILGLLRTLSRSSTRFKSKSLGSFPSLEETQVFLEDLLEIPCTRACNISWPRGSPFLICNVEQKIDIKGHYRWTQKFEKKAVLKGAQHDKEVLQASWALTPPQKVQKRGKC